MEKKFITISFIVSLSFGLFLVQPVLAIEQCTATQNLQQVGTPVHQSTDCDSRADCYQINAGNDDPNPILCYSQITNPPAEPNTSPKDVKGNLLTPFGNRPDECTDTQLQSMRPVEERVSPLECPKNTAWCWRFKADVNNTLEPLLCYADDPSKVDPNRFGSRPQRTQQQLIQASCSAEDQAAGKCSNASGISCDPQTGQETKDGKGIKTAIACIPTEPSALTGLLIKAAAGVGGGVALLLMILGSFKMITSAGNPEALKNGQDQFSSAIIGLLFIIFSVLLLQIIGFDILNIPGFSR